MVDDRQAKLIRALGEFFEVDPETLRGFVVGCERVDGEGLAFAFTWSTASAWHTKSLIDELEFQRKQVRAKESFESVFAEEPAE